MNFHFSLGKSRLSKLIVGECQMTIALRQTHWDLQLANLFRGVNKHFSPVNLLPMKTLQCMIKLFALLFMKSVQLMERIAVFEP